MAGCWKMSGGACTSDKEANNNNNHHHHHKYLRDQTDEYSPTVRLLTIDDEQAGTSSSMMTPRQPVRRPQRVSTVSLSLTNRKARRRSGHRKSRKYSEGTGHFPAGFEDDDDEDDQDVFVTNHNHHSHDGGGGQPGTSSSSVGGAGIQPAAVDTMRKTKIKKILLCGRGNGRSSLRNQVGKDPLDIPLDSINFGAELSPTLAATILNWQQFNKDLVMMNNYHPPRNQRDTCKSDGELEIEDPTSPEPISAPATAPARPTLTNYRRQSLTSAMLNSTELSPQSDPAYIPIVTLLTPTKESIRGNSIIEEKPTTSKMVNSISDTPAGSSRSAVLPRRRLRDLPVAASTDTGLLQLTTGGGSGAGDGRQQYGGGRRDALIDEDADQGKAIARSPLPLARTNAQLDLFANLNKERATRYWSETAPPGEHIWIATGASTECYIGEMDCSKTGDKVKCAACHVVVHEGCLQHLRKMNFNCKLTYREAQGKSQKEQNFIVHHHWVHKWRQEGRCKACGKSFQSKFLNKELVAIACSWCKIAYHNKHGCFTMRQIEESCTMGPLKDVMIPPSWVIKLPPRRISTIRKRHLSNNYSGKRRKRSKKITSDRLFVVKPQPPLENGPRCPILIFVNPKSGGNKGAKILHTLQWLVNPRQVFDVAALFGPRYGLEMYRKLLPHLRVLVCGGDGTVGWVLSTLDSLKWPVYPPIGIIPLGTGNDLARTLGWGASYADEPMSEMLMAVAEETMVVQLDRWIIEVTPNQAAEPEADGDEASVQHLPLTVMNNYFSIGADAHVALQFHESRSANPEVFNSRLKNRLFYGGIGTKDLFKRTWKDLSEHISIYCDGVDMTWKVQELKLHCLLFLNIPRYAGGTLPWGTSNTATSGGSAGGAGSTAVQSSPGGNSGMNQNSPSHSPQFSPPSYSDGRVEVLGFTSATLAALQVGGRGERLAQCSVVKIVTRKAIPAQVDGEPCRLAPSVIEMRFHSRVPMLQRISSKITSRRGSSHAPLISSDPSSICGARALYTSVLLRLPVAVVSKGDYDATKQDTTQLLASAVYIGDITVESETDLDQVRGIVQRLLADHRDLFPCQNLLDWAFLDYISNDSVFRLNQSQESFQSVSDICNIDNTLMVMHPGFHKPLAFGGGPNGVNGSTSGSRNERLCLLRDLKLANASEAVRIVFSSEDEETKI